MTNSGSFILTSATSALFLTTQSFHHDYTNRIKCVFFTNTFPKHSVTFEVNLRTIRKYLLRGPQDQKAPGRHRALDETLESELTIVILQAFNKGKAMTKRQVLELVRE
jgi:hypothetical protein